VLRGDAARDCSPRYYTDRLQQTQGNTWGTAWPIALSQWYSIYDRFCIREASKEYRWTAVLVDRGTWRKKLDATSVNPSSSTCDVSFTQTNPHTSGPSAGGTLMPNPSAQPVNHFHSRTTIDGSASTFEKSQQTMTSMFGQGYTHTTPSFSMRNLGSAPHTFGHTLTLMAITKSRTPP
jgi:hypothetical protein